MAKSIRVLILSVALWTPACASLPVFPGVTVDAYYETDPASEKSGLNLGVHLNPCNLFGESDSPGFLGKMARMATGFLCSTDDDGAER